MHRQESRNRTQPNQRTGIPSVCRSPRRSFRRSLQGLEFPNFVSILVSGHFYCPILRRCASYNVGTTTWKDHDGSGLPELALPVVAEGQGRLKRRCNVDALAFEVISSGSVVWCEASHARDASPRPAGTTTTGIPCGRARGPASSSSRSCADRTGCPMGGREALIPRCQVDRERSAMRFSSIVFRN